MDDTDVPLKVNAGVTGVQESTDSVYESIRHEILSGRLEANARLKISELAARLGTSTNPVREALQQLRGEGLVLIVPNQGARVQAIDMDFVRDVNEVALQMEPYLLRWFVETVSPEDIATLEALQDEIEELNFEDKARHSRLNERFHEYMYERHYNRVGFRLWKQHREILSSISTRIPIALGRREAILKEHRKLIECIRAQNADEAVKVLYSHIDDAGKHLVDQLRVEKLRKDVADGQR